MAGDFGGAMKAALSIGSNRPRLKEIVGDDFGDLPTGIADLAAKVSKFSNGDWRRRNLPSVMRMRCWAVAGQQKNKCHRSQRHQAGQN